MTVRLRRIIVLAEPSPAGRRRLESAARLAARRGLSLAGLFIEDEALLRSAALPFTREVSASSAAPRPLGTERLERQLKAQARALSRHLEQTARNLALEWSFRVTRGRPGEAVEAGPEDLVVMGRPTGGAPGSGLTGTSTAPVMLLPETDLPADRPVVALVGDPGAAGERTLDLAIELADDPATDLQVLLPPLTAAERARLEEAVSGWLRERGLKVPVRGLTGWEGPSLTEALRRLRPQALVMHRDSPWLGQEEARLLARFDAPLVMVS
jgi:hypothetical protein